MSRMHPPHESADTARERVRLSGILRDAEEQAEFADDAANPEAERCWLNIAARARADLYALDQSSASRPHERG